MTVFTFIFGTAFFIVDDRKCEKKSRNFFLGLYSWFTLSTTLTIFPGFLLSNMASVFHPTEENKEFLEERNEANQKLRQLALLNDENSAK